MTDKPAATRTKRPTVVHRFLSRWRGGYYRLCIHRSRLLGLPCFRGQVYDGLCPRHLGVVYTNRGDQ